MKYQIIFLFLSLFLFTSCFKKDNELVLDDPNEITAVISTCTAVPTIKDIYREDANRLALLATLENSASVWNDSVLINPEKTNEILGALISVHNGTNMIYRDSVIAVYGIHTWPDPLLDRMIVKVDTNQYWVKRWKAGNQYTTNTAVDDLMERYSLRNVGFDEFAIGNFITLESDMFLNINALAKIFANVDGIMEAEIDMLRGDGNDITYTYDAARAYKEIVYSVGYKNCETGCEKRRYWKFIVRDVSCNLEFRQSWGDVAP